MSNPELRRWIAASQFQACDRVQVLSRVRSASLANSVVVFDLDSTLYDEAPRSLRILSQWRDQVLPELRLPELESLFSTLQSSHMGYSVKDVFGALGICPTAHAVALESARRFFNPRFLSDEFVIEDQPYDGAAAFVSTLHEQGARVVYLTGRNEPGMGQGTRASLARDGFPLSRVHLMMKPQESDSDLLFKQGAVQRIRELGSVAAIFENEPANLVALSEAFPQAMPIFVETQSSGKPARPVTGFYRIPANFTV